MASFDYSAAPWETLLPTAPQSVIASLRNEGPQAQAYQDYTSDMMAQMDVYRAGDPNWVNPAYGGPQASTKGWTTPGSGISHIQNYNQAGQAYDWEYANNPDFAATLGEYWLDKPGIDRSTNATKFDALDWYARDAQRELAHPNSSWWDTVSGFIGPAVGMATGMPLLGAAVGGGIGASQGGLVGGLLGAAGGYGAGGGFDGLFGGEGLLGSSGGGSWTGLANQGFPGGADAVWNAGGGGWGALGSAGSLAPQYVAEALGTNAADWWNPDFDSVGQITKPTQSIMNQVGDVTPYVPGGDQGLGLIPEYTGAYGVNAIPGPSWDGTYSLPGGGFVNPSALGESADLYNPVSLGGSPSWTDQLLDNLDGDTALRALDFAGLLEGEQQQPGGLSLGGAPSVGQAKVGYTPQSIPGPAGNQNYYFGFGNNPMRYI